MSTYQPIKASEAVVGDRICFVEGGFLRMIESIVQHDGLLDFHFVGGRIGADVDPTTDIWKGVG